MKALALTLILIGCSSQQTAATTVESAYTAELVRCVDKAKTLAESKACRAEVDKAFGVDGGH